MSPVGAETEKTGVFHPLPLIAERRGGTGEKNFFFFFFSGEVEVEVGVDDGVF